MRFRNHGSNALFDIAAGAAAGGAASWLMGQATTLMYEHEDPAAKRQEESARDGKTAYVRGAQKMAGAAGMELTDKQQERYGSMLHWALGIGAGAFYGWLRHRRPEAAVGWGLAFGTAFFLVMDEGVNAALGITPPPQRFPWQAHARGLAGHMVYGLATESLLKGADTARSIIH